MWTVTGTKILPHLRNEMSIKNYRHLSTLSKKKDPMDYKSLIAKFNTLYGDLRNIGGPVLIQSEKTQDDITKRTLEIEKNIKDRPLEVDKGVFIPEYIKEHMENAQRAYEKREYDVANQLKDIIQDAGYSFTFESRN